MDQSAWQTQEDVSPGSQSRMILVASGGGAAGVLHAAHHSTPASSAGRSAWPAAAQWSPTVVVVEVLAHMVEDVVPHHGQPMTLEH
jgi:hypothetical protein